MARRQVTDTAMVPDMEGTTENRPESRQEMVLQRGVGRGITTHGHTSIYVTSSLGGVMVSVFDTGTKDCGFKSGRGDGFLRAIKIRSTPSFG
jgi:hypothetical protein